MTSRGTGAGVELVPDQEITSRRNDRIKDAVRLRRRRHRERTGRLLIEGYRELAAAIENGYRPETVYYCPAFFLGGNEPGLLAAARAGGAELVRTGEGVFTKLAYRDRPDGLVAVGPRVDHPLADLPLGDPALVVVAEAIEKPGNLGTLLRSADGAGAAAVIVADPTTDLNNPNVVRASVGTLFSVPVAQASAAEVAVFLGEHHVRIVAARPDATELYWDTDLTGPTAVVVGTEQYGLSDRWRQLADTAVRIPMHGRADSLNVATATTLLLYEVRRQRHALVGEGRP